MGRPIASLWNGQIASVAEEVYPKAGYQPSSSRGLSTLRSSAHAAQCRERPVRARSVLIASALINLLLPAQAHDIYSHLTDQEGGSCCGERDCRPAPYRMTAGGVKMFVDGEWIAVPEDTIQYRALLGDTGGGHWCGFAVTLPTEEDLEPVDRTHCAILPPQFGANQLERLGISGR
jgi:hypothetical protein